LRYHCIINKDYQKNKKERNTLEAEYAELENMEGRGNS